MAKLFIRVNPDANKLTEYVNYQKKQTTKNDDGTTSDVTSKLNYARTPGTKIRICANPSMRKRGRLNTGLDIEVVNPYSQANTFTDPQFERVLKGKDKALLQHILEYKWKKPFNYLTDETTDPLTVTKENLDKLNPFEKGVYVFELSQNTHTLDTSTEFGDIMQYVLKANSLIANSFEERNSNTPYYISHEAEEETVKQTKSLEVDMAISSLVALHKSSPDELITFCKVLDLNYSNANNIKAYNLIKDYIQKNQSNATFFNRMYGMYENPSTKVEFKARAILRDAYEYGIIVKEGASWIWYPPKDDEGNIQEKREFIEYSGNDSIIEFLSSEKFAKFQKQILEQIKRHKNSR